MRAIRWLIPTVALVVCLGANAWAEDAIHWEPNLETAQRVAAQTNRLVLIHCWAPWCGPCMKLEHEVFSQAETGRALEANFVMVKLNFDEAPSTIRHYGVTRIPCDVIVTPTGQVVSKADSPPTMASYIAQMNKIADAAKPGKNALAQDVRMPQQSTAAMAGPPAPAREIRPVQGYTDERYAEYYNHPAAPISPQAPADPQQHAPVSNPEQAALGPRVNPPASAAPGLPPRQGITNNPTAPQRDPKMQPSGSPPVAAKLQLPPGSPPLGLDGFCPVTLSEKKRWVLGDSRYGAYHHGRTYLFSGPEEQKQFLANPEAYAPLLSGVDPVLALDHQQTVEGRREFGVYFDKRIVLFSTEASRDQFSRNPNRYAAQALQAMR